MHFLFGGCDVKLPLKSPHFHQISLPPKASLPSTRYQEALVDQKYDFFISEIFPFSNQDFKEECENLIEKIKTSNPNGLVTCSLKESFPASTLDKDRNALNIIQWYYDTVFVHSDPRIFQLEESFSLAKDLGTKVIYTGFLNNPDADIQTKERKKRIVVSTGYGRFGEELIYAAINAASFFPNYEFVLILGPQIPAKVLGELKIAAQKFGADNLTTQTLMHQFQEFLCESALSISLGDSTIMDVSLEARTLALKIRGQY